MNKRKLNLLILEDNPDDAELMVKELKRQGFDVKLSLVDTKKNFKRNIIEKPDLILADYHLPSFSGMEALKIQLEIAPEIPLILVSGTIGEEVAVECLKAGAIDYVLKDKLTSLGPVVKRALKEAQEHRERERAKQTQIVLYNIAHAVNTTKNLNELFESIKNHLSTIINTANFYIALYDKESDMVSLPYHKDEKDKFDTFPAGKTLTAYVIRTGKPLWGSKETRDKLIQSGEVERGKIGAPAKIWVGVPLKVEKEIIGIIAIQSYTDASLYTKKDLEILEFVSNEIAIAIERKQTQEALRDSEEKYHALFETAKDAIFLTDNTGKLIDVNKAACKSLGYTKKKLLTLSNKEIDTDSRGYKAFKKVRDGLLKKMTFEVNQRRKDGTLLPVEITGSFFTSGNQQISLAIARDITARKRTEEALRESETRYHSIFDSATDSLLIFDLKGNLVEANPAACSMYDYPHNKLIKLSGKDIVHPGYYHSFDNFKRIVQPKGKFLVESVNIRRDGTLFDVEVRGTSLIYKGKPHLLAIVHDITERKKAEEAVKISEEKLRNFINYSTLGIWCFKPEPPIDITLPEDKFLGECFKATCVECNKTYAKMINAKPKDMLGLKLSDVMPDTEENRDYLRAFIHKGYKLSGGISHEIDKKGKEKYFSNSLVGTIKNGKLIEAWGTQTDITEYKKAEKALQESEEKYQSLIETVEEGIGTVDLEENFIFINRAAANILGYPKKELLRKNLKDITTPEEFQKVQKQTLFGKTGKTGQYELNIIRKDGTTRTILITASPIFDNNGKHIRSFRIFHDITKRKKAERELQKRLKELEVFHHATMGRESRIIELKREVNLLLERFGENSKYKV